MRFEPDYYVTSIIHMTYPDEPQEWVVKKLEQMVDAFSLGGYKLRAEVSSFGRVSVTTQAHGTKQVEYTFMCMVAYLDEQKERK